MRYKNKVSLGDPVQEHLTRVHIREERERGAREWLVMMTGLAGRVAAASGAAVPDDLRRMELGRKLAEGAFSETAAYFLEPLHDKKPELAAHGYELLWNLMAGSFLIGASATMSESAKRKIERDAKAVFVNAGSQGGTKGAPAKKAAADGKWRKEAKRMVKEIVPEGGWKGSKLALVDEIKLRWTGCPTALPGDKMIGRLVNGMLRAGEISLDT